MGLENYGGFFFVEKPNRRVIYFWVVFPVEEPNGCKFIEKNLGLFWVSSSSVNGRMNIVRISEFVLS